MPTKSTALYANEVGKVVLRDLPVPEPKEGEILIKVLYSGINPSDVRSIQFFGLKNYAVGNEFCGEVLETPNLKGGPFETGDIIAGVVFSGMRRESRHATHQEYIFIDPAWAYKVPNNVPPQAAAGLSIVVQTAADALFNRLGMPLPPSVGFPQGATAAPEGTLLVWGGATSVGMAAIQLARASGVRSIVAVASTKRHDFLRSLGATQCFDYNDDSVINKVKSALTETKGTIWGFDALGSVDNPVSQDLVSEAIPPHDKVRLVTVLLGPHDGFEICLGGRNFDVEFDLPDGTHLHFPKDVEAADRVRRALGWVLEHYGEGYKPTPTRVIEGSSEHAIREIYKMLEMSTFGKLVIKHPLE